MAVPHRTGVVKLSTLQLKRANFHMPTFRVAFLTEASFTQSSLPFRKLIRCSLLSKAVIVCINRQPMAWGLLSSKLNFYFSHIRRTAGTSGKYKTTCRKTFNYTIMMSSTSIQTLGSS